MTAISKTRDQITEELARVQRLIDELIESASENIHNIEDAIKGSEEHYRHLVENAHDVLWVFDLGLGYTYISPSVKRLRGYTVDEAMKLHIEQVLTPQSLEKARALIEKERLLESAGHRHGPGWFYTDEFEMYRKDGSTFWAEVTMNLLYDDKGAIRGVMGITRDISERKRAEEDLKSHMVMLDKE
ncbi:MAG TPA: PAS domain S-box protein, partial [Deltaproteobacteria bacterium]|nr:PAS domain S-box protein [Deltaproteobacteria bacterium]